jgi:hypothetical protein
MAHSDVAVEHATKRALSHTPCRTDRGPMTCMDTMIADIRARGAERQELNNCVSAAKVGIVVLMDPEGSRCTTQYGELALNKRLRQPRVFAFDIDTWSDIIDGAPEYREVVVGIAC